MPLDYKHRRLELGTDAIRLLRLRRGCGDDAIQCELFETYLHSPQEGQIAASAVSSGGTENHGSISEPVGVLYEALSYTWGTRVAKTKIWLGVEQFEVTENLYYALRNLRQNNVDRILWVDALCIDQGHHAEKSQQVEKMRLIYQHAEQVIIWLGSGNLYTHNLFTWMSRLDQRVIQTEQPRTFDTWKEEWEQMILHPDANDVPLNFEVALQTLLSQEWFERVWTIQEAAMATSASIACGQKQVRSRTFIMMPELLNISLTAEQQVRLDIMPGLRREMSWFSRFQDTQFGTLLRRFGFSKATMPQDKIYALLGLCTKAYNSIILKPDYTITLKKAIKNTIRFLLTESDEIKRVPMQEIKRYPDWDFEQFRDALDDLPMRLYTWAMQQLPPNDRMMYVILAGQQFKTGIPGIERFAVVGDSRGMEIAIRAENWGLVRIIRQCPSMRHSIVPDQYFKWIADAESRRFGGLEAWR